MLAVARRGDDWARLYADFDGLQTFLRRVDR
jgi:hypothetical protein